MNYLELFLPIINNWLKVEDYIDEMFISVNNITDADALKTKRK